MTFRSASYNAGEIFLDNHLKQSEKKILKMKIAATLVALAAAQAPPESKTCPDCQVQFTKSTIWISDSKNYRTGILLLTLLSMQTLIWFKNGRSRLEKNNAQLFGKMTLFADISSEEDSSTGQNPGSRYELTPHCRYLKYQIILSSTLMTIFEFPRSNS